MFGNIFAPLQPTTIIMMIMERVHIACGDRNDSLINANNSSVFCLRPIKGAGP